MPIANQGQQAAKEVRVVATRRPPARYGGSFRRKDEGAAEGAAVFGRLRLQRTGAAQVVLNESRGGIERGRGGGRQRI